MTTHAYTPASYSTETVGLFEHLESATTTQWRTLHGSCFLLGGTTFIAGSVLYFYPAMENALLWSGLLYILGSLGFLAVDLLEFFTYTDNSNLLRTNISLSAVGSTFYVIGSIGFLPSVAEANKIIGPWGFIIGSAVIATSQSWKVIRIIRDDRADSGRPGSAGHGRRWKPLRSCAKTAIGVEADAGLGALMFLIGTIMYVARTPEGGYLTAIIWIWVLGSVFFTVGAFFLNYRHFVMKLCR